jgi:hypothetical protein
MVVWPTLAALGFLALNGLVIVLGVSSTTRYEFGRNRVSDGAAPLAGVTAQAGAAAESAAAGAGPASEGRTREPERPAARSLAAHPAGRLAPADATTTGWWLVGDAAEPAGAAAAPRVEVAADPAARVLAGPFADRLEAECAALTSGLEAVAVYGIRTAQEGLVLRPSPQDRAWLSELSEQLDRLTEDWHELHTDSDPLTTLVVEIAAALVETGLTLHDCAGPSPSGGVCLSPAPAYSGILVNWQRHDRLSVDQVRGRRVDGDVQRTMNAAVADLLAQLGFAVEPVGPTGCPLVVARMH